MLSPMHQSYGVVSSSERKKTPYFIYLRSASKPAKKDAHALKLNQNIKTNL